MYSVKNFDVSGSEDGERLDKWLCKKMPELSRKRIKALLDDGKVMINGRRVLIAGWNLEESDSVQVKIPPASSREVVDGEVARRPAATTPKKGRGGEASSVARSLEKHLQKRTENTCKKDWRLQIYHEDRDIIVVEKPPFLLSILGKEQKRDKACLYNKIKSYLKRKHKTSKGSFVYALHRLDADTSGVMVFALSNEGRKLERQFRDHQIQREYTAIVEGRMEKNDGVIKKALEKGSFKGGKKSRTTDTEKGREAITEYYVQERYADATLLRVRLRTGRTHQIRVHMSEEGHPLLGDRTYADYDTAKRFTRQALHASMLGFVHPNTGKKMKFTSKLPDDMKKLADDLRSGKTESA